MLKHLSEGMSDEREKIVRPTVQFSCVRSYRQEIEEINGTYQSVLPIRSGLISPISSSLSESMGSVSKSDPSWLPCCRLPVGAGSNI